MLQALEKQQAELERQHKDDAALAAQLHAEYAAREQAKRQRQEAADREQSCKVAALTVARPSKQPERYVADFEPTYPLMGKGKRKVCELTAPLLSGKA